MASDPTATIEIMRVAVVDIGSNTARLLVADVGADGSVRDIAKRRSFLGLGEEIARTGTLSRDTISRAAVVASAYVERARREGATMIETMVTAPGRQGAASAELLSALERATGLPTHLLSAEDEGRLAYEGATHRLEPPLPEVVGVVDVGGGSTEIVVGTPLIGAAWIRSIDLGSLRLTGMALDHDPPSPAAIAAARRLTREAFAPHDVPRPDRAVACGGSARAVWHVVGRTFDTNDLERVIEIASRTKVAKLARQFDLHPVRARTLLAGAIILAEAVTAFGRPLELARGGLREGAVIELAWPEALAA